MNRLLFSLFSVLLLFNSCEANSPSVNKSQSLPIATSNPIPSTTPKPVINVYVENSGSMFGYIRTGNDFDRSISSLLTNIKVSGFADSINLFYINSQTFKQNVDIPTFIRNTNIHNASTFPGNVGITHMCALFDTVASAVNENTIGIFISDCIFSPGRGEDASRFLGAEKHCITLAINRKLRSKNLAFVVYRLLSEFRGNYFDCQDNATWIDNQRPYFIWIIGEKENIAAFKQNLSTDRIEGQLQNSYTIFRSESNLAYAVQLSPKIGDFRRNSPTKISRARGDKDSGKFVFSVAVDFSSLLVDDSYLKNSNNYFVSNPNYSIEIIQRPMGNHTHLIKVSTTAKIISPTKLIIQLRNKIPEWVNDLSDDTCVNIISEGMMQKTYGLKQIVHGIYAAYNFDDKLAEIEISINQ